MHFFTNLVFFRERYLILPFLSLLFLAAAKPRLFLRVRWRIFPALSVALLALWLFLIPGAVDIKSVLLVVGFAGAAFFLRSPKLSLLLLVAALGHIAYFSAAERVQKQEMGERLTLARANALVGWLREQTGYRWDELAPKLIFTDSYVLNALGGLYENFSVEAFSRRLENPEIGRDGYLISSHDFWKAYSGEACEVVFHALLARHAPLADFNGRGLLERVSCHEVGGQWVVKFFWAEGSGIVSWGNYGWNVSTLLEDLLPTPSLLANSSFLELSIPAASSRVYRSEVAHYGGLKLLMSCGESQVKEINLLPGAESRFSFLPQPWRRNTNHLLTAPVVVSASPCPNFSGKAVWATEIRAKDFKQTERLGGNEVSTLGRN